MIVSDSHRLLFVHVQKTGGVTISRLLEEQLDDVRKTSTRHATLRKILADEPGLAEYWTFGFVRNPWDRMVSWWSMIHDWRTWMNRKQIPLETRGNRFWQRAAEYPDFETFVLRGPDDFRRVRRPQIDYLVTRDRRADFIGRTESLGDDAATALERFGLSAAAIGRHNTSQRTGYRDYYNPTTRARVAEVFAKDLDEFGYEF